MTDINKLNQINKLIFENESLFESNRQLRIQLADAMAYIKNSAGVCKNSGRCFNIEHQQTYKMLMQQIL